MEEEVVEEVVRRRLRRHGRDSTDLIVMKDLEEIRRRGISKIHERNKKSDQSSLTTPTRHAVSSPLKRSFLSAVRSYKRGRL